VELGSGYDVSLIPNFLHHFDLGSNERFLSRVYKVLKPGGRVVIVEAILNEDRISPPDQVDFGLMMLATTRAGNAYTFSELDMILNRAGFSKVEMRPLPINLFSVVFAVK
jgi:SAM-dependent methyltransferase